jgi:hypothetical protein
MATAKTSSFILTERITVTAGGAVGAVTGTIDLGAYVDVVGRMAVAVESVDFVWQGATPGAEVPVILGANNGAYAQLTDLNRGGVLVFADDRALIASGTLYVDGQLNPSLDMDVYPDNFGPVTAQGTKLVVNDQMYFTGQANAVGGTGPLNIVARITCKIVRLSNQDWMSLALQSTAADN